MSYDEEQQRRNRVVIETPHTRREVENVYTARVPERRGFSTGMVAAVALAAIAATAIVFLFLMNSGEDSSNTNVRVNATAPTPFPTAPTPLVLQQPTPFPTPPPSSVIITPPPGDVTVVPPVTGGSAPAPTPNVIDDATVQAKVSKTIQDDPQLTNTDVIASVSNGKVTLTGTVPTPELRGRAQRLVQTVRGVKNVENKITVTSAGGPPAPPSAAVTPE